MLQYNVNKERHLPWAVERIFAWGVSKVWHKIPVNVFPHAHLEMATVHEAVVRSVVDCFCFSTRTVRLRLHYALMIFTMSRLHWLSIPGRLVGLCLICWKIAFEASQHTSWKLTVFCHLIFSNWSKLPFCVQQCHSTRSRPARELVSHYLVCHWKFCRILDCYIWNIH